MSPVFCPRCGHADTFIKGFLPDTCVCRMCQSQLDWHEIPGIGPDCTAATEASGQDEAPGGTTTVAAPPTSGPEEGQREPV
jgi:hypothetical protein